MARKRQESRQTAEWRSYYRSYYEANRDRIAAKTTAWTLRQRKINQAFLFEYLSAHPCVDCGEADPIVLEFDHLENKRGDISTMARNCTPKTIEIEISKCEVRCANCHRRRTARTRGYYRDVRRFPGAERPDTAKNGADGRGRTGDLRFTKPLSLFNL